MTTPTDKSQREHMAPDEYWYPNSVVTKLQQELEAVRSDRSLLDDCNINLNHKVIELEKELDAARAEINRLTYELDKSRDSHCKVIATQEKQLADALAKAEDYEKALEFYSGKTKLDCGEIAQVTLNKWRAK